MQKQNRSRQQEVLEHLFNDSEVHSGDPAKQKQSHSLYSKAKTKLANYFDLESRYVSINDYTQNEGGQTNKDDQEQLNKLMEIYYSKRNSSENRHPSLDIFLMLDQENDNYLKLEEIKKMWPVIEQLDKCQQGKIHKKERLETHFKTYKQYQINQRTFNQFMDDSGMDVTLVRDKIYESKYKGCCRRLCCSLCRPCNRKIRDYMINQIIKEEDNTLKNEILSIKTENSLHSDILALMFAIFGAYSEITNHITDIVLLNTIYRLSRKPKNEDSHSYKFATVFSFMSISSVYLIAYSSMINMLLFKGAYEPAQINNDKFYRKFLKLLFLTFLGPFYFIFIQLTSKSMAICASLGMILVGKQGYHKIRLKFLLFIKTFFNLTEEQIDGLDKQRGCITLFFESIPMTILQLLIRQEYLDCKELKDYQIFEVALLLALFNTFMTTFTIFIEISKQDRDGFHLFIRLEREILSRLQIIAVFAVRIL